MTEEYEYREQGFEQASDQRQQSRYGLRQRSTRQSGQQRADRTTGGYAEQETGQGRQSGRYQQTVQARTSQEHGQSGQHAPSQQTRQQPQTQRANQQPQTQQAQFQRPQTQQAGQQPQQTGQYAQAQQTGQQPRSQQAPMRARQVQQPQWGPLRPVTIGDVAATDVVTAQPDAPVPELAGKMAQQNVGTVVITRQDRPVGLVTDRKIALALQDTADASQLRASDVMTDDLFTVQEDTNIFEVTKQLSDRGFRRTPVVDDQGTLKGIVSIDDVLVLLTEEFENVGRIIQAQSPRY